MLPAIQMQVNRIGHTITTVRGLKSPNAYRTDKIKILINDFSDYGVQTDEVMQNFI